MSVGDVAVVIPAYNAEKVLARALRSVLTQMLPPREVLVVDDGSRDGTSDVARSFGAPVRCIRQENAGVAAARNRGIAEATAEWIAFLDADDWWEPERLAWGVAVLDRHPELNWVAGRVRQVWPGDSVELDPAPARAFAGLVDGDVFSDYFAAAAAGVWFHTNTMLIRRSCLLEVGPFDVDLAVKEDGDMWCRVAERWPAVGYVIRPAAVYDRRDENSLTLGRRSHSESLWRFLAKHVPPASVPRGGPGVTREAYFRMEIRRALRHAVWLSEYANARRLLSTYGAWLGPFDRFVAPMMRRLPPGLVGGVGDLARRTRLLIRRRLAGVGPWKRP